MCRKVKDMFSFLSEMRYKSSLEMGVKICCFTRYIGEDLQRVLYMIYTLARERYTNIKVDQMNKGQRIRNEIY